VPALETLLEADAKNQLNLVGLIADVKYQDVLAGDASDGRVILQGTQAGIVVELGSKVKIVVGRAVAPTTP